MEIKPGYQELGAARRALWQKHMADWETTTLSASDYCRERGLNQHQFKYWQYQLAPHTRRPKKKQPPKTAPSFIPVKISPTMVQQNHSKLVIHIGTKSRIEIESITEISWIKPLLHYLAEV